MKKLFKLYIVLSLIATIIDGFHLGFLGLMKQLLESVFYLIVIAGAYSGVKLFFKSYKFSLSKNDNFENSKRYYNCPRCGAIQDHPGTCLGMCSDNSSGVFRM